MPLENVLATIPGLGGYLGMEQYRNQQAAQGMQQAMGLLQLAEQAKLHEQQAQHQRMQGLLTQAKLDEISRQNKAREQFVGMLPALYPDTPIPAGRGQTGGIDDGALGQIMNPGTEPNKQRALMSALVNLDQGGISDVLKGEVTRAGGGADPMVWKTVEKAREAYARGEKEIGDLFMQAAQTQATRVSDVQLGHFQGVDAATRLAVQRLIDSGALPPGGDVRGTMPNRPLPSFSGAGPQPQAVPQPAPTITPQPAAAPVAEDVPTIRTRTPDEYRQRLLQMREQAFREDPNANVAALDRQLQAYGGQVPQAGAPAPSFSSPAKEREVNAKTREALNADFIKDEFRPTQERGNAALKLNMQIDALRSMSIKDKTGWGTDAKEMGARILHGLGIAPDEAKKFASEAQSFRSILFEQNWALLQAQKGVQTEGDAVRAQKVFAQLSNTPEANEFIWDFAKATNDLAIDKARFYRERRAKAVGENSLYDLETQWGEYSKNRSIWDAPSMKKWKGRDIRPGEVTGQIRQGGPAAEGGMPGGIRFLGFEEKP